ncbi:MAG: hypothetical protein QOF63_946 [Thermoanaerobaculia bacterium]|jgi:uncharacterized repeat protein (TIGR01451 family)|nr:hypothetical protein [Thermoanaerobaculia bacterium]
MPLGRLCAVAIGAVISIAAARPLLAADPDIAVTIAGPSSAVAGDDLTYYITIENKGPYQASVNLSYEVPSGTVLYDENQEFTYVYHCSVPFGTNKVGCVIANLVPGWPELVAIKLRSSPLIADGTTITNTATITPTNKSASVTTTLHASADVRISESGPDGQRAGKTFTYTINVLNDGISTARDVIVTDVLPAGTMFVSETQTDGQPFACATPPVGGTGTMTCSMSLLDKGGGAQFQIVIRVNDNDATGSTITNAVSVSSSTPDPNAANNSQSIATVISATLADLSVSRMQPQVAIAGTTFTYSITAANGGPNDAQNVVVSHPLPPSTTFVSLSQPSGPEFTCTHPPASETGTINCSIATLAAGAAAAFIVTAFLRADVPYYPQLEATVSVASATPEAFKANNVVDWYPEYKRVSDLAVTLAGPPTVKAGSDFILTEVITNNGPSDPVFTYLSLNPFSGFVVSVRSGASCSITSAGHTLNCYLNSALHVGESTTVIIAYHVVPDTATGTTVHFSAGAGHYGFYASDPNPDNNGASVSATVTNGFVNLALKNTPSADPRAEGTISYTLVVSNAGPSPAEDVVITDDLPSASLLSASTSQGTCGDPYFSPGRRAATVACTLGTIAAGAQATIVLAVRAPSTPGSVFNSATVVSNNTGGRASADSSVMVGAAAIPALSPPILLLVALFLCAIGSLAARGG